jgi:ubiquinone biosynthesis protein
MSLPNQLIRPRLFAMGNGLKSGRAPIKRPRLRNWRGSADLSHLRQGERARVTDGAEDLSYVKALRKPTVKVSFVRVGWHLVRMFAWFSFFWVGVTRRWLAGRTRFWIRELLGWMTDDKDVEQEELDRARHRIDGKQFRILLERRLGGVMIKVGQQLAQRVDFLPAAYCDELKDMVDDLEKTIKQEDVEAAIKRQTKKHWSETFADFDFHAKGSASVACVYRAFLRATGDEVAVKIRRPNIQRSFAADLDALSFILIAAEFLTILRYRLTENFRPELRESLLEELDFTSEARYQELFRRYHKRRKKLHVTAPKIFFELSGEEVLVTEFVTGRKVKEIIKKIRDNDTAYLADLQRDGIDPKIVAKRLVRSRYYSFHECPMFHGDPHPGNILVQPNNEIVMIDFGACGVFSERDRNLMWQMNYYYAREDVAGMVNMVISIMEPILPHVRTWDQFKKELQDVWWKGFYGIKSKHAEEWERTSFRLWLGFFQLMRKHQIGVPRNMVRMIRATLLYDTVAAGLHDKINVFKEFQKYSQGVARRARYRIEESAVRQLLLGPDDSAFLKLQQIANVGNGLLYRLQKFLDDPEFTFAEVAGKIYSAIRSFVKMIGLVSIAAVIGAAVIKIVGWQFRQVTNPFASKFWIIPTSWILILLFFLITYGRRMYMRFGDADD